MPNNSQRTGEQTRAGFNYSYYLTPAFVITAQTYGQREDAEVGFWADWEFSFAGGFAYTFNNPLWQSLPSLDLPAGRRRDPPQL